MVWLFECFGIIDSLTASILKTSRFDCLINNAVVYFFFSDVMVIRSRTGKREVADYDFYLAFIGILFSSARTNSYSVGKVPTVL